MQNHKGRPVSATGKFALAAVAFNVAASGCTTASLATTIGKEPKLFYLCESAAENPASAGIRCEGKADRFLKATLPLQGDCNSLNAQARKTDNWNAGDFRPSTELDVTIMSHLEYYLKDRLHAGLDKPLDISIVADTDVGRKLVYIRVPAGYVTDFTSTPKGFMQMFIRTFAKHIFPSLAHDFLYAVGPRASAQSPVGTGEWYTRKFADSVLRSGMLRNGSGWLSYTTVYTFAQIGGGDGFGTREELRFFAKDEPPPMENDPRLAGQNTPRNPRVVVAKDDYKDGDGYSAIRDAYIRICPVPQDLPPPPVSLAKGMRD